MPLITSSKSVIISIINLNSCFPHYLATFFTYKSESIYCWKSLVLSSKWSITLSNYFFSFHFTSPFFIYSINILCWTFLMFSFVSLLHVIFLLVITTLVLKWIIKLLCQYNTLPNFFFYLFYKRINWAPLLNFSSWNPLRLCHANRKEQVFLLTLHTLPFQLF
jgi:hypothetical protein